jgi:hypothetical protein
LRRAPGGDGSREENQPSQRRLDIREATECQGGAGSAARTNSAGSPQRVWGLSTLFQCTNDCVKW